MAIIRINKTKDYTVMSNYHFREKEMSLKAKGLLSLMLSLPNDWDYSINGLVAICKENETAINSTLKELKDFGYLSITKLMPNQTENGRIQYVYDIYEQPIGLNSLKVEKQEGKKQGVENLGVVFLGVENPIQLNNKEINNNKELNTKYIYIVDYLNLKAKTNYRASSKTTQAHIKARLNEGFTVEDFKTVIDKKVKEWKRTEFEKFLRPETLFGSKFENYLNSPSTIYSNSKTPQFQEREYTDEEMARLIDSVDDIKF